VSKVQRVGIKLFCREGEAFPFVDVIPIFHGWIQRSAVPGLLIDVADYSHVPDGPGVILVSHEGIYALDETGSRRGLAYSARFPAFETLGECLRWSLRAAVSACRLLEKETDRRILFSAGEVEVYVNDRLSAPNDARGEAILNEELGRVLSEAYPGVAWATTRDTDPRQRLSVTLRTDASVEMERLAETVLA
jgi:hypothetical protein